MKKLKVMTVIGTRPEIIRLSSTIKLLDKQEAINHILVHTGQNYDYELNQIFFDDLELRKPDYYLDAAKDTPVKTIATAMMNIEPIIQKEEPEAFLVLGDTNSALTAIVAKKYKVPIFHMEAGNRCFDESVPEEINRKIVDHIADINLPYSSIAREYLINEGIPANTIIKSGSPMYEVITKQLDKINSSAILKNLNIQPQSYYLVSIHREENVDNEQKLKSFVQTLNTLAQKERAPILISMHPRTKKRIKEFSIQLNDLIQVHKPFNFTDYCHLQKEAIAVLSDSGTISEETSILGLKSINIRSSHERPEAMEYGTVMMTGFNPDRIYQSLDLLKSTERPKIVFDYTFSNVSDTIVKVLISYVDYINSNTWKKDENHPN